MERRAALFKDDTLRGISLAIKNLQHQEAEAKSSNVESVHVITKLNPHFRNLINYLDLAFCFCLKDERRGYWPLVKKIAHSSIVQMVEKHKMAENDIKKGYIWLFLTFIEDSLESYLKMIVNEKKLLKQFYTNLSLMRDKERCEILFNFLAGIEHLTFSINFEDPYLDYGHDPVLRQEKIIIRVHAAPANDKTDFEQAMRPDVTIIGDKNQTTDVPDLLAGSRREVSRSPYRNSVSLTETDDDNIAVHVKSKRSPKKRTVSEGDTYSAQNETVEESIEMEEDNFIPEILGSPEYTVCVPDEPKLLLHTSDPMLKTFSQGDVNYQDFLNDYKQGSTADSKGAEMSGIFLAKDDKEISNKDISSFDNEVEDSFEGTENTLKTLNLKEKEGYQFTYVSDDDHDIDDHAEEFQIYRTDSFDKFCRRSSFDESTADEQGQLAEHDTAGTQAMAVAPKVSRDNLRGSISPEHLSRISIDKLNNSRLDTKKGILLPYLPRRPELKEALKLMPEIMLDQNSKVMISLEIFQNPAETTIQVFKVFVGYLAGVGFPMYLLVSNMSIYLLKKRDTVQSGFVSILSIPIDSINKIQTGLNYQDLYIFYESGCAHISTADEITTRSLMNTVRAVIKSNSLTPQASSLSSNNDEVEPVAQNTYNELDLVLKDWLLCHTQTEDPEVLHFSLVNYSNLSANDSNSEKVVKSGYLHCKQTSIMNVVMPTTWSSSFFALSGAILSEYTSHKKSVLKATYNLSSKCGGCIRSGEKDGFQTFQILERDGSTCLLELGTTDEDETNDWIFNICQVVADAKNGEQSIIAEPPPLTPVGMFLTNDKLYIFTQDTKSGRLSIMTSCSVQQVTQVCVDHDRRTFCCLLIDEHMKDSFCTTKTVWLVQFQSEYELGKFETQLFNVWHSLYQVPLQFVILSDELIKKQISHVTNNSMSRDEIGREEISFLVNTC